MNRVEKAQRQELQDAQALLEALEATDLNVLGSGWGVRRGMFTEAYGLERVRIVGLWNEPIGRAAWLGFAGHERRIGAVIAGPIELSDEAFGITAPIMAQILVRLAAGEVVFDTSCVRVDLNQRRFRFLVWPSTQAAATALVGGLQVHPD